MRRVQIFCIGASSIYGVGGTKGGWVELLKADLHQKMYGPNGIGEMHEVYNLAVPGAVVKDLVERTKIELKTMSKPGRLTFSIVQIGANNAKAIDEPDNFVSTPEEYRQEATDFLELVKKSSDAVLCLGMRPMDQTKVMPIVKDKEKHRKVYFPNDRIATFEKILGVTAASLGIQFIPLFDELLNADADGKLGWQDGIHPNDAGYEWLYKKIKPVVMRTLEL